MIRKTVVALALSLLAASAHAQIAAYGAVSVARLSGIKSSSIATPYGVSNVNDYVNPLGGTFGAYYDFMNLGPFRLGVDARGVVETTKRGAQVSSNGGGARVESALGGVRGAFHTPLKALDGYVQGSAGLGRSDFGLLLPSNLQKGFEYHVYVGAQIHITPYFDWRAFEVGYGGIDAGSHNYALKTASTGIVFHFPVAQ